VSEKHPAWTRHDLLKQLALVLPPETRQMSPEEAQELLLGLAEEALSGRSGEVMCLEAPEMAAAPAVAAPRAGRAQRLFAARRRAVRRQDAILQPPKPEITPSARILQLAAEHDIEPEAGG
jgi:hypothetical protein